MIRIKRVMVVDDDQDDKDFFELALKEVDAEIICIMAKDGEDALDMLNDESLILPDYIFLDLNMPRLNGIQCLEKIKESERLKHIPVAICSTTKSEEENTLKKMGALHFFSKPTTIGKMSEYISIAFSYVIA